MKLDIKKKIMVNYKTKEENITGLIMLIKAFIPSGYSIKNKVILDYEGTTLPPFWLEEMVISELESAFDFLNSVNELVINKPEFINKEYVGNLRDEAIREYLNSF